MHESANERQTGASLPDEEARDRLLLHSMDHGIIVRDGSGHIIYVNPAAYRMFHLDGALLTQLEHDGFPGWRFLDAQGAVLDARDFPGIKALRSGTVTESQLVCFWLPHVRMPVWLSATAVPLFRDGESRPYRAVATFSDVTELKRTRDLLEQTQALGHIGGFELTTENNELVWTAEMYRLFDLPHDFPITLERTLQLFAPSSLERVRLGIPEVLAGKTVTQEYEIVTALGRRRWIASLSRPLWRGDEIIGLTGCCQDITERKRLELELRLKAATDPVTGLSNRESILGELQRQIDGAPRGGGPTLLYIDLDRFKVINDALGATAGDRLLAAAAERLRACLPRDAHCGRFAGDEFLAVLPPATSVEESATVADTIVRAFRQPFECADTDILVTASIGIAPYPDDGNDVRQLLRHADAAMLDAKLRGRDGWQLLTPEIRHRVESDLTIERQLHQALAHGEFRLVYQPQLDLADGRLVAVEALLRWNHPLRGELHPSDFVPLAESSGDIVAIGMWTIDRACSQLREWRERGLGIERIAVNVTYRQLLSESFVDSVVAILRRHDLPGSSLELELVERTLIEDTPDTLQMFKELRKIGISIVIDDFGEGYSALNYLRRLPVDGFKIGYGFMRHVPRNAADAAICDAIIRIGHALGLGMIAEGIESEEQRAFLLERGLTLGQGFLFSGPLDAEPFLRFAHAARLPGS